jgi:hypothetical protein
MVFRLKGVHMPAQGNALGIKVRHRGKALKGRNKSNVKKPE